MIDLAHLEIWIAWQTFKAPDSGLSLTEVMSMPVAMRHDFNLFEKLLADHTRTHKQQQKLKAAKKAPRRRSRK